MTNFEIFAIMLLFLNWLTLLLLTKKVNKLPEKDDILTSRLEKKMERYAGAELARKLQRAEEQANIAFNLIADHRHNTKCHTQDPSSLEV